MAIETVKLHTAWLMERGGKQRIAQVADIEKIEWNRVRDEVSTATLWVSASPDSAQADILRSLIGGTGRYEIAIWRGEERVWEGPITLVTLRRNGVVIEARDVFHYLARLRLSQVYDNSYPAVTYVVERARVIIAAELLRKDIMEALVGLPSVNVLPYMVDHQFASDAKTSRKTVVDQYTVYEHIDSLAAKAGMDYTVIGRAIHLWDTSKPVMGYTPTVTESDFLGEIYVSVYGMELGTFAVVSDGQGTSGYAGGADPYYGLVERLETAYDEDESAAPTVAELESQAERNLAGRSPTPLQVRIPDNSSLNMNGVLTMAMLVPGIYIPMLTRVSIVEVAQLQKLQKVRVTEDKDGETVQVTLFPASSPDEEEEEP